MSKSKNNNSNLLKMLKSLGNGNVLGNINRTSNKTKTVIRKNSNYNTNTNTNTNTNMNFLNFNTNNRLTERVAKRVQQYTNTFSKSQKTAMLVILFGILALVIGYFSHRYWSSYGFLPKPSSKSEAIFLCMNKNDSCSKIGSNNSSLGPLNGLGLYGDDGLRLASHYLNSASEKSFNSSYNFWIILDNNSKSCLENKQEWEKYNSKWKHVLHRQGGTVEYPGFWLTPNTNDMWISIGNHGVKEEGIMLRNLEMNKWINITMVLNNSTMEVYKNGKLVSTIVIRGDLRENMGALYIGRFKSNQGFPGQIAYVQYYNKAIEPKRISKLYRYYNEQINKNYRIKNKETCRKKILRTELCDVEVSEVEPEDVIDKCR